MAERRRRASTSSVDTVDGAQVRWLQETSVVRSVASNSNPDDWPCFELHDVVVYDSQGQAFDNPLYASTRGPFTVRGRLTITDPSQRGYMIARVKPSTPIEIRGCGRYCIGLESVGDASSPQIWVAGKGGWYEIVPSEAYMPIYSKMCEATIMYYTIFDHYAPETDERPPKKPSKHAGRLERLHDVFLKYIAKVGDGSTLDEVIERCRDHAPFFIAQFTQETSPKIVWSETDFYSWIMHQFTDVAKQVDELIQKPNTEYCFPPPGPAAPAKVKSTRQTSTRSASIEDASPVRDRAAQIPERPKPPPPPPRAPPADPPAIVEDEDRPPVPAPQPVPSAPAGSYESALESVVSGLEQIYEKRGQTKKGLVVLTTLNTLYFDYKFPNFKDGTTGCHKVPVTELLHYHAKGLLERLDKAKYEPHEIYGYLEELARQDFAPRAWRASDFPLRLVPRNPMPRQTKPPANAAPTPRTASGGLGADSDEENQISRPMGKSIRRPGQRSRKSGLRAITSSSSKKRGHAELHSGSSDSEGSAPKRSHFFSDDALDGDPDTEMDLAPPYDAAPTPDKPPAAPGDTDEDNDDDAAAAAEPVPIVIRVERIPSARPPGPDGTWACDQTGCEYVLRGADDDEQCQERIRSHLAEHERQATRLNLAVSESSRGHVPVNHLLEKLKRMSEKKPGLSLGRSPIKRKLIV